MCIVCGCIILIITRYNIKVFVVGILFGYWIGTARWSEIVGRLGDMSIVIIEGFVLREDESSTGIGTCCVYGIILVVGIGGIGRLWIGLLSDSIIEIVGIVVV